MANQYDVVVIGGGPGGYVAAVRAAQLGMKVAVVEREHLAGICSNWGCIPTKALLGSAQVYHHMSRARDFGLKATEPAFDISEVVKRSRQIAARMNNGVGFLMKKNKIDVIWGEAKIRKKGEIVVGAATRPPMEPSLPAPKGVLGHGTYNAKHIIIATGARPRILPGIEPDGKNIWTYFEALVPQEMPKSVIVMGSGAIGIEFASFYATMGADVAVVELMPNILPAEDEEISTLARKSLEKRGIKFLTKAKVTKVEKFDSGVKARIELDDNQRTVVEADKLISAIGVQANIENIGLEDIGVRIDRGFIQTDQYCRTDVDGVYAIGDVAGAPMLAHKAEHEAIICIEKIAGKDVHPLNPDQIPGCTYCDPQVASVGLTETAATKAGYDIRVGRFPFAANGKAVALGEPEGLVKTIFDKKTGELLGAHMIGAEVTELVHSFVVAMNLETTEQELMHTVFPHPTLSEMIKESVLDAYDQAINI